MTLHGRSVIPAAVTHSLLNILGISGVNGSVAWGAEYRLVLWGIAAAVLFRYGPVPRDEGGVTVTAEESEPVA
jgi:hypothetical protein